MFWDKINGKFKHYRITEVGQKGFYNEDQFRAELIAVNDMPLERSLGGSAWKYEQADSERISWLNNK
jgi:hypothetical protein